MVVFGWGKASLHGLINIFELEEQVLPMPPRQHIDQVLVQQRVCDFEDFLSAELQLCL